MIIALAGRRIDPQDASVARFPLKNTQLVRERLAQLFVERRATILVSAAACGADLLALEAAGERGMRRRIVLPFSVSRFRAGSVVDRPGEWGEIYDRVIAEVEAAGDLVIMPPQEETGDAIYALANRAILDEAQALAVSAEHGVGPEALLTVIVWEGKSRGEGDLTEDLAIGARARGIGVVEILTTR